MTSSSGTPVLIWEPHFTFTGRCGLIDIMSDFSVEGQGSNPGPVSQVVCWLLLYVLTTSKVISGCVTVTVRTHGNFYSAAPQGDQVTSTKP